MRIYKYLLICGMALVSTFACAQSSNNECIAFKHLSIAGRLGTTGVGVDVAMPINRHLDIRGGADVLPLGTFNIKAANNLRDIYTDMAVSDPEIRESMKQENVTVGINVTMITGHLLVDYYPWKSSCFHITAGAYFGNCDVLHIFNREDGAFDFLNHASERVQMWNELFNAKYANAGIKFGDYLFTADDRGNIDIKMRTSAVRPYIGIGWGRNYRTEKFGKVSVNFDLGTQMWGSPKFKMNNGEKVIKSKDKDTSGIFGILSGFDFWPSLTIRIAGDIF